MLRINNVNVYGKNESIRASGYPMRSDIIGEWDDDELVNLPSDINRAVKLGNVPTGTGHDNFLKGIIVQFDVTYPNYWTPQFQRYHFMDIVSSTSKMHRLTKMDLKKSCNEYVDDTVIDNLNRWIDIFNTMKEKKVKHVYQYDCIVHAGNKILQKYRIFNYEEDDKYGHDLETSLLIRHNESGYPDLDVKVLEKTISEYEVYMKIISNCPMGLEQTMRVTTSYLQLKTIYLQRRHHKLKEDWGNFCDWCLTLPNFEEFCLKNK